MMTGLIILILFYLLFPLVILWSCKKWNILRKAGSLVLAYVFGLVIGTAGILPKGSEGYRLALQSSSKIESGRLETLISEGKALPGDIQVNRIAIIQDNIISASILLALPLLLFSLNIKRWLKYAKVGFISVALALVSGVIMVTAGFFIWKDTFPDTWKIAGMFEGMYTGGTPNFAAIKLALDVSNDRFVVLNTYDLVVGAFLLLFFITIAPKIFRKILPAYKEEKVFDIHEDIILKETEDLDDYSGMFRKRTFLSLLEALGLTISISAIGVMLGFLVPADYQQYKMAVIVLSITTLGILASLINHVNRIEKTFQLGMYLILIFSLTVSSSSDLRTVFSKGVFDLILFISWCYFGPLVLHLILARIFRVDADNFLVTATAFIFSPPFVPMVANALRNKNVIITGITGGVIGYLLGNFFGTTLAFFLQRF